MLQNSAEGNDAQGRDHAKDILRGLVGRIVCNCSTPDCRMHSHALQNPVKGRDLVASPTRFELVLSP